MYCIFKQMGSGKKCEIRHSGCHRFEVETLKAKTSKLETVRRSVEHKLSKNVVSTIKLSPSKESLPKIWKKSFKCNGTGTIYTANSET